MGYPITEAHKKAAVENIERIAPQLGVRLINDPFYDWQVEVFNPKTHVTQMFDAYLVGESFLKQPQWADLRMLDEMAYFGLVKRVVKGEEVVYE